MKQWRNKSGIVTGLLSILAALLVTGGSACDYNQCVSTQSGDLFENRISINMEVHGYFLEMDVGEVMVIRIDHLASTLNPRLELISPEGSLMAQAGISETRWAEIISRQISSEGNYSILVRDINGNGKGEYWLSVQSAVHPVGARFVKYDDIIRDTITDYARYIPYQFDAMAGEIVTVQMISIDRDFQPLIRLFGPTGNSVGTANDNEYAIISHRVVPIDGTYTLLVGDNEGNDLGEYFLILLRQPSDADDEFDFGVPTAYSLRQNYPNPFNPETIIDFALPRTGYVVVTVHNVLGEVVRTLVGESLSAGYHSVAWDGCDEAGRAVSSGIYLYRLTADDYVDSKKMLLVK